MSDVYLELELDLEPDVDGEAHQLQLGYKKRRARG